MDILVRTLRQLECFQVQAETDVINASWDTKSKSNGLADSVGLMVYEGTQVYLQESRSSNEQLWNSSKEKLWESSREQLWKSYTEQL
jgi:hypothetical protein